MFVKGARYDKMMEAFGGVGVNATSPDELKRAVNAAIDSGKPTLINAVIDPAAGSESGRIGNLNPQSALRKKIMDRPQTYRTSGRNGWPRAKPRAKAAKPAKKASEEGRDERSACVKLSAVKKAAAKKPAAKKAGAGRPNGASRSQRAAEAVVACRGARPARRSTA